MLTNFRIKNRIKKIFFKLIFYLFIITDFSYSQITGGQTGQFLNWGAGARSFGMGTAYISVCDDASATYWNPAGLSKLYRKEFMGLHVNMFPGTGTTYDFISFVYPTEKYGVVGFNMLRLYTGGFEKISISVIDDSLVSFEQMGSFSDDSLALTCAYGRKILKNVSLGVSSKFIRRQVDIEKDFMFSVDIGIMITDIQILFPGLDIGAGMKNIIHFEHKTQDRLPVSLRIGFSRKVLKERLIVSADFEKNINSFTNYAGGIEYKISKSIAFRMGFNGETSLRESSIGLGTKTVSKKYGDFGIDIAFCLHQEMGTSVRTSGSWRFGKSMIYNRDEIVRGLIDDTIGIVREGNFLMALLKIEEAYSIDPGNQEVDKIQIKLHEIIAFIPRASGESDEDNSIRKGVMSFLKDDIRSAVNFLKYAYYKNPKNERLLSLLNKIEKDNNMEITDIHKEQLLGFTIIDRKIYDARQAVLQGKYDEAVIRCQEVLELEPENITAMEIMGSAFFMMNKMDKAKEIWKKVIEIDPTNKIVKDFLSELE